MKATKILQKTLQAEKRSKIICHEGGSRSSKTWSIFQFFLLKALSGENITVTIVRDKLTWIKSTLLLDLKELVGMYGISISPDINVNRSEQVYDINGSEFAFHGLDYSEKLHGRTQDWFWINEAMEVAKKHFDQLEMRTKVGGILDYNPYDDMHWVFDVQKRGDVEVIKSTMLDNPFLSQRIIDKIKSYEPTEKNIEQGTADNYMWEVYGLGNKARLQGTIFNNWDIVPEIPPECKFVGYGLDFGFTNDPTALVALYVKDNELYWDELLYETGLLTVKANTLDKGDALVDKLNFLVATKTSFMYADSSDPRSIETIRRTGFNIKGADKGQDSIIAGINLLKGYKMHITRRSVNLENELRKYKWAEDKTGKSLNIPVDVNNHACDAMRYVAAMTLNKQRTRVFTGKAKVFA